MKAQQVGEDRERCGVAVDLISVADLAVAIAVCGVRKLKGNKWLGFGPVVSRPLGQQFVDQGLAHEDGKEFVQQNPMERPERVTCSVGKNLGAFDTRRPRLTHKGVVYLEHGEVDLRDEQVRVVARIGAQRDSIRVSRQIISARSKKKLCRVLPLKQKRVTDRPVTVEPLEIQLRRASIA